MSRRWLPACVLALVLIAALSGFGAAALWVHRYMQAAPHQAPQPHALAAASSPVDPWADYANERHKQHYWVNDPVYAAKCDGTTDDATAFTHAIAAAAAVGGTVYVPTGVTCMIGSEVALPSNVSVHAGPGPVPNSMRPILRAATGGQRSIFVLNNGGAPPSAFAAPETLNGLVLDANELAKYAVLALEDNRNSYKSCTFENALIDGYRKAGHSAAASISSVTPGGGNTSPLISVSQPDPTYLNFISTVTIDIKVSVGATLASGNGQYVAAFDGVPTYATAFEPILSPSNLVDTSGSQYLFLTGLQITFPSGTYATGDTWHLVVTPSFEDGGAGTYTINNENQLDDDAYFSNGTLWGGTSSASHYGPLLSAPYRVQIHANTSTVSTVAQSQLVTGTGTTWITSGMGARTGDPICIDVACNVAPLVGAIDDTHLLVQQGAPFLPTTTTSGLQWAIGVGAGHWGDDVPEAGRDLLVHAHFAGNAGVGLRAAGAFGPTVVDARFETMGFADTEVGSPASPTQSTFMIRPHDETSWQARWTSYLTANGHTGSTVLEPTDHWQPNGTNGSVFADLNAQLLPYGGATSFLPLGVISLVPTAISFTSASQQLPPPTFNTVNAQTSLYQITPSASFDATSTPFIAASQVTDNQIIILQNMSVLHTITIPDDYGSGSGVQEPANRLAFGPGDILVLQSHSGKYLVVSHNVMGQSAAGGVQGAGSRVFETVNTATPTTVFTVDNSGARGGLCARVDLSCHSSDLVNSAYWRGLDMCWPDTANTAIAGYPTIASFAGTGSGGAIPLGWQPQWTTAGFQGVFSFAGDASHTVICRVNWTTDGVPLIY